MQFNGRNFGKTDYLEHTPFVQYWDDSNINPPPPGSSVMITEVSVRMITEDDSLMITE